MNNQNQVSVISVVGWSNSGKTTFLEKLVAELKNRNYRVGIIKHHHGEFELDRPGKDTWRMARAGAACTAIAGPGKVGLVLQTEGDLPPTAIAALMPGMDIVITEGYKGANLPQIEVRRAGCGKERPASRGDCLVAVVGDGVPVPGGVPCYDPTDAAGVADFIEHHYLRQGADRTRPVSP